MKDLLKDRGRGEEADHFRKENEKLIQKMRERARVAEIARALADKLKVDDAQLVERVRALGLDQDTGPAILLAPLVQVAWSDRGVTEPERKVVLEIAESRGISPGTPAHDKLVAWLKDRPSDALFDTATECMRLGLAVLPAEERDARVKDIVASCRRVAAASGGSLGKLLGISDGVSGDEAQVLDVINARLRSGNAARA